MCESRLLISDGVEDEAVITEGQRSLILLFNQSGAPSCSRRRPGKTTLRTREHLRAGRFRREIATSRLETPLNTEQVTVLKLLIYIRLNGDLVLIPF